MYTYLNTKTGASFVSAAMCSGGDWVLRPLPENGKAPETDATDAAQKKSGRKKGK